MTIDPRISICRVVEEGGGCWSPAPSMSFEVSVDMDVVLDDSALRDESENSLPIGYNKHNPREEIP